MKTTFKAQVLFFVLGCAPLLFTYPAYAQFSRLDSLLIIAASGEPRFKTSADSCQNILVSHDSITVNYLLKNRLPNQTPRQKRYTETLFTLMADSGKNIQPGVWLTEGLLHQSDSSIAEWLYVASVMRDRKLAALGLVYLKHDSLVVRRMAYRVLGAYPDPSQVQPLLNALQLANEKERDAIVRALAAHAPFKGCEKLRPLLSDTSLVLRQTVIALLTACADGKWNRLNPPASKNMTAAIRRDWLRLAYVVGGSSAKTFVKKESPYLSPEILRFLPPDSVLYSQRRRKP